MTDTIKQVEEAVRNSVRSALDSATSDEVAALIRAPYEEET